MLRAAAKLPMYNLKPTSVGFKHSTMRPHKLPCTAPRSPHLLHTLPLLDTILYCLHAGSLPHQPHPNIRLLLRSLPTTKRHTILLLRAPLAHTHACLAPLPTLQPQESGWKFNMFQSSFSSRAGDFNFLLVIYQTLTASENPCFT